MNQPQPILISPRTAASPFDGPEYDIILRSSDGIDFKLERHLLRDTSREFATLAEEAVRECIKARKNGNPATTEKEVPVVFAKESSDKLYTMLRFTYPSERAVDDIVHLFEAMDKFNLLSSQIKETVTMTLLCCAFDDPGRAFAIACRFDMHYIAVEAASRVRGLPPPSQLRVGDIKDISAGAYFRFMQFLKGQPALNYDAPLATNALASETSSGATSCTFGVGPRPEDQAHNISIMTNDDKTLYYSREQLFKASPILAVLVSRSDSRAVHPGILLSETFASASDLLELIHHRGHPTVENLAALKSYVHLAWKYKVIFPMTFLRNQCLKLPEVKTAPLRVFLYAISQKWYNEASLIAQVIVRDHHEGLDSIYAPEMETVAAKAYHGLLQYNKECQKAATTAREGGRGTEEAIMKIPFCLEDIPELSHPDRMQFIYTARDLAEAMPYKRGDACVFPRARVW